MFLIGILSSPVPFILLALAYLLGTSTGIFAPKGSVDSEEESFKKNINFEVLNPNIENIIENIHYFDVKNSKKRHSVFYILWFLFQPDSQTILDSQILNKSKIEYDYLYASNLYNRPPPSFR